MPRLSQTEIELKVFIEFLKACPYQINSDFIKQNKPPMPDISCQLLTGENIDFEITECIDVAISKPNSEQKYYSELLSKKYEALNPEDKDALKSKYEHSSILIKFNRHALKHNKTRSVPNILEFLKSLQVSHGSDNEYHIQRGALKGVVSWIYINSKSRYLNGPSFDISTGNSYSDPIIECIARKFKKKYSTENPAELLVYYASQPEHHVTEQISIIEQYVRDNIGETDYRRIWIYLYPNKIGFVYPPF